MVDCLLLAATWGYPVTTTELRLIVMQYLDKTKRVEQIFSNNLPGIDWCHSFLKRKNVLANRLTSNIKTSRAQVSPEIIESYFNNLEATVKDVLPENIIN